MDHLRNLNLKIFQSQNLSQKSQNLKNLKSQTYFFRQKLRGKAPRWPGFESRVDTWIFYYSLVILKTPRELWVPVLLFVFTFA